MNDYPPPSFVLFMLQSTNCPVLCLPQANISHLVSLLQSIFSTLYLQRRYAFRVWLGEDMFYTDKAICLKA